MPNNLPFAHSLPVVAFGVGNSVPRGFVCWGSLISGRGHAVNELEGTFEKMRSGSFHIEALKSRVAEFVEATCSGLCLIHTSVHSINRSKSRATPRAFSS